MTQQVRFKVSRDVLMEIHKRPEFKPYHYHGCEPFTEAVRHHNRYAACGNLRGTYEGALLHKAVHEKLCDACTLARSTLIREATAMYRWFGDAGLLFAALLRHPHLAVADEHYAGVGILRAVCENA